MNSMLLLIKHLALRNQTPDSQPLLTSPPAGYHIAPAHQVLFTVELLCNIMAHLPPQDILRLTRVCHFWRNALRGPLKNESVVYRITSTFAGVLSFRANPPVEPPSLDLAVQQALFLKPAKIHEVLAENELVLNLDSPISLKQCSIVAQLNPFAKRICGLVHLQPTDPPSSSGPLGCPPPCESAEHISTFNHSRGLWRDMYLTQPPCQVATVVYVTDGPFGVSKRKSKYRNCYGLRLGEIYRFIRLHSQYTHGLISVSTRIDGFVARGRFLPSHTMCVVRDGVVCRPEQLSSYKDLNAENPEPSHKRKRAKQSTTARWFEMGEEGEVGLSEE